MDVINENLRKVCSHTRNIYYDWGGQFTGTKCTENAFLILNSNCCKTGHKLATLYVCTQPSIDVSHSRTDDRTSTDEPKHEFYDETGFIGITPSSISVRSLVQLCYSHDVAAKIGRPGDSAESPTPKWRSTFDISPAFLQ